MVQDTDIRKVAGKAVETREQVAEMVLNTIDGAPFLQAAEDLIRNIQYNHLSTNFISIENGTAVLNAETITELIEDNSLYATDPKEIKLLAEMKKISNQINSFNEMLRTEYGFTEPNSTYSRLNDSRRVSRNSYATIINDVNFSNWFTCDAANKKNLTINIGSYLDLRKIFEK